MFGACNPAVKQYCQHLFCIMVCDFATNQIGAQAEVDNLILKFE